LGFDFGERPTGEKKIKKKINNFKKMKLIKKIKIK
jgi:hypothetical protein